MPAKVQGLYSACPLFTKSNMNKSNISESHKWRKIFSRLSLIIISVAVIVLFIPRNSGPQFRYDVGKPWMYGSLIATFDFPIYKSEEAIKFERDSMMRQFEPYFNYNADVETKQLTRFFEDFKSGIPGLPSNYTAIVADKLHAFYDAGIIGSAEYSQFASDTSRTIRVVEGKNATVEKLSRFYSTMMAYEQIFRDARLAPHRAILQRCNLNDYIEPNIVYDKERSESERNDLLSQIPQASGMVLSGQKLIDRGEIVDEYTYRVLSSFEKETQRRSASTTAISSTIVGQVIFVLLFIVLFTMYLGMFRKDYFNKPRSIAMLYTMITIFPIMVSLLVEHNLTSVYVLPFAIAPIFIRVFMDSRTAFLTHVVIVMLCAAAVKYQYEFIIVQLVAGLAAIYSLRELSQRVQILRTAFLVALSSSVVYFAMQLMTDNTFSAIDYTIYKYFLVNGVLILFAYPLMVIIEKMFGFISDVTLIELSNTSKDLLRRMSEVAPGTFQHSIMVGNLASAIAERIGAKAQLVRTGALYHDIGKMQSPAFFTENQNGNNPLDKMSRIDAAHIIISHVEDGLKLADKYGLPPVIKDFISTHHGAGMTKYFYISYKNEHPNEPIDDALFAYPGPNPFTREQAILMMADSVEAAARSLPEYTEISISNLVNKIIDQQVKDGFFAYCPITFRDIAMAKLVLIERLKSIYHTRVSYPELKK